MNFPAKLDVVYPLGVESDWDNNELRYSLRSLERHFEALGQVWIVGHKPDWLTNVRHIPFPDAHKSNKDANLIDKIRRVCQEADLSEHFLFFSDDQYVLKTVSPEDFGYNHLGDLRLLRRWGTTKWQRRLQHTYLSLRKAGKPTWNLDAHVPYRYRKSLFDGVMSSFDYPTGIGCTINTLFLNHQLEREQAKHKLVHADTVKAGVYTFIGREALLKQLQGKRFLNHNTKGLCPALKEHLMASFPQPSRFEEDVQR